MRNNVGAFEFGSSLKAAAVSCHDTCARLVLRMASGGMLVLVLGIGELD